MMKADVILVTVVIASGFCDAAPLVDQNPNAGDALQFSIKDTLKYDDNVYRLPDSRNVEQAVGSSAQRHDVINQLSAAARGRMQFMQQDVSIDARIDDNRYRYNDSLNNVSGMAIGNWNWVLSSQLSGRIGAEYDRWLGGFADSEFFDRDVISEKTYYIDFRQKIFSRMRFSGGYRNADLQHGLTIREGENFTVSMWKAGIAYETPAANSIGFDYVHVDGRYPNQITTINFPDPDYLDSIATFWVNYSLSEITGIEAKLGRLHRDYAAPLSNDFSGNVGQLKIVWSRSEKLSLEAMIWRDLKAYREAGAEYFLVDGFSLGPNWLARERLRMTLHVSVEKIQYQTNVSAQGIALDGREDKRYAGELRAEYTPTDLLEFDFSYRHERRDSNQADVKYRAGLGVVAIKLRF